MATHQGIYPSNGVDKESGTARCESMRTVNNTNTSLSQKFHEICAKIADVFRAVLRALGLNIIAHAFTWVSRVTGKGMHEPTKIAIRQDRTIALLRSLVHLVPIGVALCEIILNWNTYYVGVSIYNQAVYQLLAKTHEIMIQASLATIIFSYIRHEMTVGSGIPFGALFSGLQMSQIAYLWSMEFWGTIRSAHLPLRRKFTLLTLIVACIILATLSGPSSAVLLVPRLDFWPAGSSDIWLNATIDELFPTFLDGSLVSDNCSFAPEGVLNNACPSSEWERIQAYLNLASHTLPQDYQQAYSATTTPGALELTGKNSQRQLYVVQNEAFDPRMAPHIATTQQVAITDALTTFGSIWYLGLNNVTARSSHGSPLSDQSDAVHTLDGESYQPLSVCVCETDVIRDDTDTRPVAFPFIPNTNDITLTNANITLSDDFSVPAILHPGLSRSEIANNPGSLSQYRLQWVELPQDLFNGSSIGAVILLPQPDLNSSSGTKWPQHIMLCNLAAGWGTTTLHMHTNFGNTGSVSSEITVDAEEPGHTLANAVEAAVPQTSDREASWIYPKYPQRPINITREWAQYLNPIVQSANRSVFDLVMQHPFIEPGPASLPALDFSASITLISMLANGLSRIGYESTLQGSPKSKLSPEGTSWIDGNYWLSGKGDVFEVDATQRKDWVKLHVNSTLQGYAYNTQTVPPRFAMAVLTIYCIIALTHWLYSGISGISSTCWDSIAEVTALAMNSTPTTALRNTCAGISELHIFQLPVRVLAKGDGEGDGEHLELVFGSSNTEDGNNLIKVNRTYGTMPSSKQHFE